MKLSKGGQTRNLIGAFALGILVTVAVGRWSKVPFAIAAVEGLAVVEDTDSHITISFPHLTPFNEMKRYRVRLPKYNYPAYNAYATFWHERASRPAPPVNDDAWVESLSDY